MSLMKNKMRQKRQKGVYVGLKAMIAIRISIEECQWTLEWMELECHAKRPKETDKYKAKSSTSKHF